MTSPRPLLIVQTGRTHDHIRERLGDFDDWIAAGLRAGGAEVQTHDPLGDTPPPAPETLAGIVLTGSHAMVSERETWSEALVPWLQQAVRAETPVLGICYGHQLLAHALGGEVARHPAGLEIGTVAVQRLAGAEGDALLGHLPARFGAQVVHEQTVRRLPPGAVALAANAHEPHHAFRVGPCAWGVQFHPEFSDAVMRDYVACFAPALQRAGMDVAALEQGVQATPESASLLARFAQLAAAAAT